MPKVQPQTSFPNCTKFYIIHGWSALSSAIHLLTDKLLNFLFKLPGIANWGTPLLLPSLVATNWNSNSSCWIVPCTQCCPLIIFLLTPRSANLSLHSPVQNLTSAPIKLFSVSNCLTAESLFQSPWLLKLDDHEYMRQMNFIPIWDLVKRIQYIFFVSYCGHKTLFQMQIVICFTVALN